MVFRLRGPSKRAQSRLPTSVRRLVWSSSLTTYLSVRNWDRFQHYKDRRPLWIKFYVELLDDVELRRLPIETRLLWDQLLLLAARLDNAIPNDPEELWTLTRIAPDAIGKGIDQLIKGRWLRETQTPRRASKLLAKRTKSASPETEKEKETPQTPLSGENGNGAESQRAPEFVCEPCGFVFKTQRRLDEHLHVVHYPVSA
jgi:hypothetical protein